MISVEYMTVGLMSVHGRVANGGWEFTGVVDPGFAVLYTYEVPHAHNLIAVCRVKVSWSDVGVLKPLHIEAVDDQGASVLALDEGCIRTAVGVEAPTSDIPGEDSYMREVVQVPVVLPRLGWYAIVAKLADVEVARTRFCLVLRTENMVARAGQRRVGQ
jgi:hypothetical protein